MDTWQGCLGRRRRPAAFHIRVTRLTGRRKPSKPVLMSLMSKSASYVQVCFLRPGARAWRVTQLEESHLHLSLDATAISGNRELSSTSSLPLIQDGIPDCHGIDVIKRWILCKILIRPIDFIHRLNFLSDWSLSFLLFFDLTGTGAFMSGC